MTQQGDDPIFDESESEELPDVGTSQPPQEQEDNRDDPEVALNAQEQKEQDASEREAAMQARLAVLEQQLIDLQMKEVEHGMSLRRLHEQAAIAPPIPSEPINHPAPLVFIAKKGSTDLQWQERLVDSGALANYTGGRVCASDGATNAMIVQSSTEYLVIESRDPTTGCSRYVSVDGPGDISSIKTLGDSIEGSESLDSTTWDRASDNKAPDEWYVSRVVYNEAGDKKLYSFLRKRQEDSKGRHYHTTGETKVEVFATEDCAGGGDGGSA